jgi:hypothetical protein
MTTRISIRLHGKPEATLATKSLLEGLETLLATGEVTDTLRNFQGAFRLITDRTYWDDNPEKQRIYIEAEIKPMLDDEVQQAQSTHSSQRQRNGKRTRSYRKRY